MASQPGTTREQLLQRVIQCLARQGIGRATFRSLAASLNISTYPLVHHFGSKEQLLGAVVAEVERRLHEYADQAQREGGSSAYWEWCVKNPELLRLDLEILLSQGREDTSGRLADLVFRDWHDLWTGRLTGAGMSPEEAETEATIMVALGVGLQMDLVATGDTARVTRAFRAQLERRLARTEPGEE